MILLCSLERFLGHELVFLKHELFVTKINNFRFSGADPPWAAKRFCGRSRQGPPQEKWPRAHGRVQFVQLALPSRTKLLVTKTRIAISDPSLVTVQSFRGDTCVQAFRRWAQHKNSVCPVNRPKERFLFIDSEDRFATARLKVRDVCKRRCFPSHRFNRINATDTQTEFVGSIGRRSPLDYTSISLQTSLSITALATLPSKDPSPFQDQKFEEMALLYILKFIFFVCFWILILTLLPFSQPVVLGLLGWLFFS